MRGGEIKQEGGERCDGWMTFFGERWIAVLVLGPKEEVRFCRWGLIRFIHSVSMNRDWPHGLARA